MHKTIERKVHWMFYVENPKWEKPRESSNSNYHYEQRCTMVKLQGNNLELTVFATGGGNTQRRRPLPFSPSLSLSAALFTSVSLSGKQKMSNNILNCLP